MAKRQRVDQRKTRSTRWFLGEVRGKTKEELINLAMKNAKTLNTRFSAIEEKGLQLDSTAYQYAYNQGYSKDTYKMRYSTSRKYYDNLDTDKLERLVATQEQGLASETSTLRGLSAVRERALHGSYKHWAEYQKEQGEEGVYITKERTYKYFLEHGGSDMMVEYDSGVVYDDLSQYLKKYGDNVTNVKKFLNAYGRYTLSTAEKLQNKRTHNAVSIRGGEMFTRKGEKISYNDIRDNLFAKAKPPKKIFKK